MTNSTDTTTLPVWKRAGNYLLQHLGLIVQIAGIISIVYSIWATQTQIGMSREATERSLDWERKKLTQEKVDGRDLDLTNQIRARRKQLQAQPGSWIYSDSLLRRCIRNRFNFYESLCRGITVGHDETIVQRSLRTAMLTAYERDRLLIDSLSRKNHRQAWSEYSAMMDRWKADTSGGTSADMED